LARLSRFVYAPAEHVHHGTLTTPTLRVGLGLAAPGPLLGMALVAGVLATWFWLSYLAYGDEHWEPSVSHPSGHQMSFGLINIAGCDAKSIGNIEVWARLSDGRITPLGEPGVVDSSARW